MSFSREKHVKFWRMNANLLPHHYLSNDSSRMTLGYFIVAALDLLDALDTISLEVRQAWIEWIYACQCPEGGFRGFSGTNLNEHRTQTNRVWDPANLPATFFALATLLVLEDDLHRVHRDACLTWLPRLQRSDGSFGETLGEQDSIEGGRDLRYCCCAAGISFILQSPDDKAGIINWDALASYIRSCQSYNGGFGESPSKEPHSGLTYCAIASLAFTEESQRNSGTVAENVSGNWGVLHWILDRQTDVLEEDNEGGEEDSEEVLHHTNDGANDHSPRLTIDMTTFSGIAGFNGREGKIADTCYCFWNTGALAILGYQDLIDNDAMQRYLLEKVQHMIGGFGKGMGAPPDVMHSYLGLAALSVIGHEDIKPLDPRLCISQEAVLRLSKLSWKQPVLSS